MVLRDSMTTEMGEEEVKRGVGGCCIGAGVRTAYVPTSLANSSFMVSISRLAKFRNAVLPSHRTFHMSHLSSPCYKMAEKRQALFLLATL